MGFLDKLTSEFKELKASLDDKNKPSSTQKPTEGHPQSGQYQQQPAYAPQQQYQQSYPPPSAPQHQGAPGQPPLPAGWIAQFDQNSQRWYYIEQATGRSQWEIPSGPPAGQYAPPPSGPPQQYPPQQQPYGAYNSAPQYPDSAHGVKTDAEAKKKSDKKNMLLGAAGGLAAGGALGAMMAHDSDSDDEHHASAAPMAPSAAYGAPASSGYADPGYGAPMSAAPAPVPTGDESDRESLAEAQEDYNEAVLAAADSDASSSELEDLQEAHEELQEEQEDYYED